MHDAQAVEFARQSWQGDGVTLDGELVRLGEGGSRHLHEGGGERAQGGRRLAPFTGTPPPTPTGIYRHVLLMSVYSEGMMLKFKARPA